MVKAESLTIEFVMKSTRNGLFYSSNGPEIIDVDIDGNLIRVKSSPVKAVSFIANNGYGRRFTALNNPLVEVEYKPRGNEKYIRIEIEDEKGKTAWTNPIRFTD